MGREAIETEGSSFGVKAAAEISFYFKIIVSKLNVCHYTANQFILVL